MKKKILIAAATFGLLGIIVVPHAQAAAKPVKKTVAKTHTTTKSVKTKKTKKGVTKKKKVARVTHSIRRVAVNSPNAPLITQ